MSIRGRDAVPGGGVERHIREEKGAIRAILQESMAGNYRGEQLVVVMLEKEVAGWLKNVNWTSLFIYARKKSRG